MKRFALLAMLACNSSLHAAPDPHTVGQECYEKYRSSGSFDKIQECIDNALPQRKAPPSSTPAPVSAPRGPVAAPTLSKPPEPERAATAASAAGEFQALDPDQNHAGKDCTYFTKQSVRSVDWDGNREKGPGRYTDDSLIAYGKWVYRCESGRWVAVNPTWTYSARQLELKWAQVIEGTGVAPKDPLH